MYNNSKIANAIRSALIIGASSALVLTAPSFAAENETDQEVERIQVTGSSIKRTDLEGALPITSISADDIVKSGVTSVPDLIAQLPAMQGFTTAADSVGGSGGGYMSASLRDLGEQYTLVLLNGRRMASADSGSTIDLNAIPIAAIERVEILMDGASALYGSDAIAGVVNFILKRDYQQTSISARYDKPQDKGGESNNFSISTGFGDLDSDGYNFMLTYSRDEQDQLRSVDRSFARTGIMPFSANGNDYVFVQGSANAIPGNAYVSFTDEYIAETGIRSKSINPYREANGQCGPNSAPSGTTCMFDYTSTLEIFPESTRDNIFLQGLFNINDDVEAFVNASWSQYDMITRIAPYPTGTFTLPTDSAVVQENVIPHLTAEEVAGIERVAARWRILPGGNRTTEWGTTTRNFTSGLTGELSDISFDLAFTYADSERKETRLTGYPIQDPFMDLVTSGAVNVFATFDSLDDSQRQAVKDTMFTGLWEKTDTQMLALEGTASTVIAELPAGDVYLGAGFDYREVEYSRVNGEGNTNEVILFESASTEYDLSRETYGMFLEAIVPVFEGFELTAAIRYDNIGEVTDSMRTTNQVVNDSASDTTYKLSASYRPSDEWLIRASLGTGFKSATMREIAEPRIEFGVTSGNYACPFGASDPMAEYCFPEAFQYDVFREGYAGLNPETSEQRTLGIVYSPSTDFGVTIDWWQVNLEDQVTRLTEGQIFGDPVTYRDLFTTKTDLGTGDQVLAIIQAAVNIGESNNQGIDWGIEMTNELAIGTLKTTFNGTYIIESETLRLGTDNLFDTSLGQFGNDDAVTFRNIAKISNTLTHGDFSHTINIHYRSGYRDALQTADECSVRPAGDLDTCAPDVQLYVPSYTKVDWVSKYFVNDNLDLSLGINNLFDKQPSTSLRSAGAGHQVGYDPRYVDVLGRTFYLRANYTF